MDQNTDAVQVQREPWYVNFKHGSKRTPLVTVIIAVFAILILGGTTVIAINWLKNDSATFNSSISSSNPTRQHVLQVDGSGELVASLSDRTQNPDDQVRFKLTLLDADGQRLQRVVASVAGGGVQLTQNVEPGLYTFIVSTDDELSEQGAFYTLEILYPNDIAELSDKTAPTLEIQEPELGATVSGVFKVSGVAADETELSQIAVRIGESDWVVASGLENWSAEIDSSLFDNGNTIVTIRATDASGNGVTEQTLFDFQNEASNTPPSTNPSPTNPTEPTEPTNPTEPINPPVTSGGFFEDFTGNTGLENFKVGVYHRNIGQQVLGEVPEVWGDSNALHGGSWTGDHDLACGSPDTQRQLSSRKTGGGYDLGAWVPNPNFNLDKIVYMCRDHMMTSMGDVDGYSILWFSPDQSFTRDSTKTVSWSVNITDLGGRQWWEVSIVPKNGKFLATIDWLAGTANIDSYDRESLIIGSGPFGNTVNITANGDNQYSGWQSTCGLDSEGCDSKRLRRPFSITDNGNGTITVNYAGVHTETFQGSFPQNFEVYFKDHNYTPDKDGMPAGHTWHWDNISVQ